MNAKIAEEIQVEQDHGRQKYGVGPKDYKRDDAHVAGLAVSAVEAIDRKGNGLSGDRIQAALNLAYRYGQIDGGHHKAWVIDQMVRCSLRMVTKSLLKTTVLRAIVSKNITGTLALRRKLD